ncbi:MAG: hypothetical protein JNM57_07085 [Cyclobacteriaceae bacterium]|nr:hypothetical protein [Cyclobacteriaceae bacterium]
MSKRKKVSQESSINVETPTPPQVMDPSVAPEKAKVEDHTKKKPRRSDSGKKKSRKNWMHFALNRSSNYE